jgi:hypothetical protein
MILSVVSLSIDLEIEGWPPISSAALPAAPRYWGRQERPGEIPRIQDDRTTTRKGKRMQQPTIKLPVQGFQQFLQQQQQNPPETVYINFSAEIVPSTTETLIATVGNAANQGVKTVYLMLSTPGGQVMNGLNLYNVLRGLPVELITHNVGNVDSIGNTIFMAGSRLRLPTLDLHVSWGLSPRSSDREHQHGTTGGARREGAT